jgi:hypothetical protein
MTSSTRAAIPRRQLAQETLALFRCVSGDS